VLDRIVHLSERLVPRASGSIMLVSEDRLQLHLAAAPSAPQVLKDALATLPIGDDGGPCGMAACTKAVIISADALGDPLLAAWGPLLREIGTAAVWSVPFFEAPGTVAGTLAVHLPTPRRPDQAELDALTTMASLAGIATQRRAADRRLRATEQQLLQAQKMEAVGQLAGGIAHDFNNLLTVILATSQLLLDDATQASVSAEATEDLRLIRESAERAGVLTRQLLTFSRRQPWQPRSVDVFQVFARLRPMFERVVGARITVDLGVDAAVAPVWIDEAQLDQVLVNLVVNARDAMPNGGLLLLEAAMVDVAAGRDAEMLGAAPGAYVRVVVRDTGTGMDDATRQRIFEPFFTTKALGEGTGLGLASCYGIVNRADGVIGVSSELGQGTTFTILLPAAGARRLVPAAIAG
jgi:signal transduction histidine kinase